MKLVCLSIVLLLNLILANGATVQPDVTVAHATTAAAPKAVPAQTGQTAAAPKPAPAQHNEVGTTAKQTEEVLVIAHDDTLVMESQNAILRCSVTIPTNSEMKWYKGEVAIKEDPKHHIIHAANFSLEVVKVGSEDVGEYFCVITLEEKIINTTVVLYASPQLKHFEKSKNLVQGDPLVLECNMWGWPHPEISWKFNGSALNTSDPRIKITHNSHNVPGAKLRLENVDYPDGGDYSCVGTNNHGTNSTTITVNIKNKYAALWPFLGICLEVAILCTIIFIYERRHAKKMAEEEEEDDKQEEAEHLASNNEKKEFDDIRHRDVKT